MPALTALFIAELLSWR